MNNVNFVKNIDNLGRIVIPMDIRRKLQISTGDVLSITCNDKNIMLTKYSSLVNNQKIVEIVKSVVEVFNVKLILTNKECVLYSNIVNFGAKLDNNIKLLIKNLSPSILLDSSLGNSISISLSLCLTVVIPISLACFSNHSSNI